jgi:hypothetical protein
MLTITNHKLIDPEGIRTISYLETPNHSGRFAGDLPDTIVIHYTAGASLKSSASWLTDRRSNASAHLIIGKSGEVIQLTPLTSAPGMQAKATGKDGITSTITASALNWTMPAYKSPPPANATPAPPSPCRN